MNPEKKAQRIEKAALKAAKKALRRHPGQPVTREELMGLRVQTIPTWLRIVLIVGGLGLGLAGIALIESSLLLGLPLALLGLGSLLFGTYGRSKRMEEYVDQIGPELAMEIVKAVLNSLDG